MLHFIHPWALLLLPLPWLVRHLTPPSKLSGALLVPERVLELLEPLDAGADLQALLRRWRAVPMAIGWIALVLALAGPQGERIPMPAASGRDLIIALDLSVSMRERDVRLGDRLVSRAEAVKTLAGAFVRRREGDRVGLIAFADKPFLIAPLTYDVRAVEAFLDEVAVGLPGRKTAIGDAIGLAVSQLARQPRDSRVLVLLTDGDGNAGGLRPEQAATMAHNGHVRVHTIGFGGDSGDGHGQALASIADATGGRHFAASDVRSLQSVYEALDVIEPTGSDEQPLTIARDFTQELLGIALLCGLLLALGEPGVRLPLRTAATTRRAPSGTARSPGEGATVARSPGEDVAHERAAPATSRPDPALDAGGGAASGVPR